MTHECFFVDESFYTDMEDMIDDVLSDYDYDFTDLQDDWEITCTEAVLEPVATITKDWLYNKIGDERFPEDCESTTSQLEKALALIPYDKVMEAMPKLYYPSRKKFTITKQDVIDYCK